MSTSRSLDPSEVCVLEEGSFEALRVQVDLPDDVDPKMVLTGQARRFPLIARVLQEGPVGDLIGTYWGIIYLISDRFVKLLTGNNISGWQVEPISIARGSASMSAWLLMLTGRCGPVFGVGGETSDSIPSVGQFLDPTRWDGSDMFTPDNLSAVFMTLECAQKLEQGGLTNLEIEHAGLEALPR
jgi:hypothetical protein